MSISPFVAIKNNIIADIKISKYKKCFFIAKEYNGLLIHLRKLSHNIVKECLSQKHYKLPLANLITLCPK